MGCVELQESAKEKDEQLENLRRSLADLREKAEMAEPLLRLGSPDTLQSLVTKNVSVLEKAHPCSSVVRAYTRKPIWAVRGATCGGKQSFT